jgi:hypothetical protein
LHDECLHNRYAVTVGQYALSSIPALYRELAAAQLLPSLSARRWWHGGFVSGDGPAPFTRRLTLRFPRWDDAKPWISTGFMLGGHRVSCTLRRLPTSSSVLAEAVARRARFFNDDPSIEQVDLDGDHVAIELPDDNEEDLAAYDMETQMTPPPSEEELGGYIIGQRYLHDAKPAAAAAAATNALHRAKPAAPATIALNRAAAAFGAAAGGKKPASRCKALVAGPPASSAAAVRLHLDQLARAHDNQPLLIVRNLPDAARDAAHVSNLMPVELRFTVEVPTSLGVRSSTDFASSWFLPATPSQLPERLCQRSLRAPGSFLTDFFYRIEDDFLPQPWATIEGQPLMFSTNHIMSFDEPLAMWIDRTQLDAATHPLILPVTAHGCALANSARFASTK